MSNNRKRNLKRLATNIMGAAAAASFASGTPTSANVETTGGNQTQNWLGPAGLGVAVAGAAIGLGSAVNTYSSAKEAKARNDRQDAFEREKWTWTLEHTPDETELAKELKGTGIDAKKAAETYNVFVGMPHKSGSVYALKLSDFRRILATEGTVAHKIAWAAYTSRVNNEPTATTYAKIFGTLGDCLRLQNDASGTVRKGALQSRTWLNTKKRAEMLNSIPMLWSGRNGLNIACVADVGIGKDPAAGAVPLLMNKVAPASIAVATKINGGQSNFQAQQAGGENPAQWAYAAVPKITDGHYDMGNNMLSGDTKLLLQDRCPASLCFMHLCAYDGYKYYQSNGVTAALGRETLKGLKGGVVSPGIVSNLKKGCFKTMLVFGRDLTTDQGAGNLDDHCQNGELELIDLDTATEKLDATEITKLKSELGTWLYGELSDKPVIEDEEKNLKL